MKFLLIGLLLNAGIIFANTPDVKPKIYTQDDFDKKVKEEVIKTIDIIKAKSVAEITKELFEKENKLKEREMNIAKQEEILASNNKDLQRQILTFEDSKKKIIGCVEENKSKINERVSKMVEVISNMKPQQASDLLSTQESDISVKILSQIDAVKASKIFNLMDKEISARLQKQYLNMKR